MPDMNLVELRPIHGNFEVAIVMRGDKYFITINTSSSHDEIEISADAAYELSIGVQYGNR